MILIIIDRENMEKIKFIFDLDGTLTKYETIPIIAEHFNIEKDLKKLTELTVSGNIPFMES